MRFMSSNTDVMAASPFALSSLHNSTAQRVPMMASLRVIHSACAALGQEAAARANKRRNPMARARSKVHVCAVHGGDYAACVKLPAQLDTCEESRMKKLLAHFVVRRHRCGRRHSARLRAARAKKRGSSKPRAFWKNCAHNATRSFPIACWRAPMASPSSPTSSRSPRWSAAARQRRDGGSRRQRKVLQPHHGLHHRRQCRLADRRAVHRHRARVHHAQEHRRHHRRQAHARRRRFGGRGAVGRAASAATDQNFTAEVYSYSRNRGLFAGVSLDGSVIAIDTKSNNKLYGKTCAGQRTSSPGTSPRMPTPPGASNAPSSPAPPPAQPAPARAQRRHHARRIPPRSTAAEAAALRRHHLSDGRCGAREPSLRAESSRTNC